MVLLNKPADRSEAKASPAILKTNSKIAVLSYASPCFFSHSSLRRESLREIVRKRPIRERFTTGLILEYLTPASAGFLYAVERGVGVLEDVALGVVTVCKCHADA